MAAVPQLTVPSPSGNYVINLIGDHIWTIGRGRDNPIVLRHHLVSRQHAAIQSVFVGGFYLVYFADLGSTNGSRINGQRVKNHVLLSDGDRITLGELELQFRYEAERALRDSLPGGLNDSLNSKMPVAG